MGREKMRCIEAGEDNDVVRENAGPMFDKVTAAACAIRQWVLHSFYINSNEEVIEIKVVRRRNKQLCLSSRSDLVCNLWS
jgi:hypothetical protein